jgi:hypothetical protein
MEKGLKLNGTHGLLAYVDDVNLLGDNIIAKIGTTIVLVGKPEDKKLTTKKTETRWVDNIKIDLR